MASPLPIIIVGSGSAALTASVRLASQGRPVKLFCTEPLGSSGPSALSLFVNGSPSFAETIRSGEFLADQELPFEFCRTYPSLQEELRGLGIVSGGEREMNDELKRSSLILEKKGLISLFEGWEFMAPVLDADSQGCGAVFLNLKNLEVKAHSSRGIILCAEGPLGLFGRAIHSAGATGAELATLYRRGVPYANGEFFQFSPAAIQGPDRFFSIPLPLMRSGGRFLVTRAGRSRYFLEDFYPRLASQIPSLVVCRAIMKVLSEGGGEILVDLADALGNSREGGTPAFIRLCQRFIGIDPRSEPVPVSPVPCHSLGGLRVDDRQMTNLPGIFAAGASQCRYHGANALESNLLCASVFSAVKAADACREYAEGRMLTLTDQEITDAEEERGTVEVRRILENTGAENPFLIHEDLKKIMDSSLGLTRRNSTLKASEDELLILKDRCGRISLSDRSHVLNQSFALARRLPLMMDVAHAILRSARLRDESRGFHFKADFPCRNDERFLKTSLAQYGPDGPEMRYEDVDLKYMRP